MNRKPAALLSLILALWGCAEGGSRGSGISTAVLGNVVRVQTDEPGAAADAVVPGAVAQLRAFFALQEGVARAGTDLQGINVVIEGTGIHGQTDVNGDFSLSGDFEGMVNLIFELPDGRWQAHIALNVPAAGKLTLNNVVIDTQTGAAIPETQAVDFDAIITAVDCPALALTLVSAQHGPDDVDDYTLRLDTSSVQNNAGDPVPCADLRSGERAWVQGFVNPDGTFGEATVTLEN